MTILLEIKERLKRFYGNHSLYIMAGFRFIAALVSFSLINQTVGFMTRLKNPVISLILALLCVFLPTNAILLFSAGMILAHLYTASLEFAVVILVVFLLLFLLYYHFSPQYSYVILLTPIAFMLKIPYVIPLAMGLLATPVTIVPVAFGIIIYYLLYYVKQGAMTLTGIENTVQKYVYIIDHVLKSPEMYLIVAAFSITIILVYFVRKLSVDYAWSIAVFSGVLVNTLILLIGDFMLDISIGIFGLIVGSVISMFIVLMLQLFVFSVDYSRTEYVQFEDDEYYYYVKAVPKMTITKRDKTVKRINPQKKVREDRRRNMAHKDVIWWKD